MSQAKFLNKFFRTFYVSLQVLNFVMHRYYNFGLNLTYNLNSLFVINCIISSNRNQEYVYVSYFLYLFVFKFFLSQISQMTNFHFFRFDYKNCIKTSLFSLGLIVIRRNPSNGHSFFLIFSGSINQKSFWVKTFNIVMIEMLMSY